MHERYGKICQLAPAAARNQLLISFANFEANCFRNRTNQWSGVQSGQAAQSIRHCYLIGVLTFFRADFILSHSHSASVYLLHSQAMLDHIKHSIVSLQIAKNMAHPINGIYNGPTITTATSGIMMASPGSGDGGDVGGGSSSSGGSGIGIGDKANETHLSLKNELVGDDEDDSATENGKCHPSVFFFGGHIRNACSFICI